MEDWLAEIELGFEGPPVSMGVRKLGPKPWLIKDEKEREELLLKQRLRNDPHKEVFLSRNNTERASESVISLIRLEERKVVDGEMHPLDRAGLSVQEDLCLLRRKNGKWLLEAASLSFPSRWRLREKLGKSITDVHSPVEGYPEFLRRKVDSFMDRLGTDPTWRRNWFIHPDNSLYQPERPIDGDPIISNTEVGDNLFVRSERQTLRKLESNEWILFTIRVQQAPLRNLIQSRFDEFNLWITEAPISHHEHKGLSKGQVYEISKGLKSIVNSELA